MIAVVIPAFNEAAALDRLLPRLPRSIDGHLVEVIVSDDGSSDGTAAVAEAHGAVTLSAPHNRGKGAALRKGIARARLLPFDALVLMDGDGQHDPDDLPALTAPILGGEADVVTANRYGADEGRGPTPRNRYLVRRLTSALLARLLGHRFADPYCGYKALSPVAVGVLGFHGNRYQSELEILFDCVDHDLAVVEVPIARVYGPSTSKMGYRHGAFLGRCAVLAQYVRTIVRRYPRSRLRRRHSSRATP